jgi:hypothetical protein
MTYTEAAFEDLETSWFRPQYLPLFFSAIWKMIVDHWEKKGGEEQSETETKAE